MLLLRARNLSQCNEAINNAMTMMNDGNERPRIEFEPSGERTAAIERFFLLHCYRN